MKKSILLTSLFMLPLFSMVTTAQDKASGVPAIKIATQGAQNEGKLLSFSAFTSQGGFYVDFGNDNTRDYPWGGTVAFSDRTYGDTIRVYSLNADDPIQGFSCKDDSIKGVVLNEPALRLLDISGNLVSSIDLSNNPALETLIAARNQLQKLEFPNGVNLTHVDLNQNSLEVLDLSGSTKLEYLDVSVNNLRVPKSISWPESDAMTYFDVSCNKLFNLDYVPSYPALKYFAANHNKLSVVDLSKFPELQTLKLQYNTNISTLTTSVCPDLKYLDVTGTKLTEMELSSNHNIETLKASLLGLSGLDVSAVTELRDIIVEKCGLTDIDFSANTKLQKVNVAGNALTSLNFANNDDLTYLDCNDNKLTAIDMSQLAKVDTLNCSLNDIENLDLSKNTALMNLNCSSNYISVLDLKANKNLRYLNCAGNKIENLSFSKQLDIEGGSVKSNNMSKEALEAMFASLPDINGMEILPEDVMWKGIMAFGSNPGSEAADITAFEAKGWKSEQTADVLGDASAMFVISPEVVGTKYVFAIDCAADMYVDWGDGVKVTYKYDENNSSYQNLENVLKGTVIKIYAPEATNLGFGNNAVTGLNVSNMPNLKSLACFNNAITELDVSKNEQLEQLGCDRNPLTSLNLGEAKSLQKLFCASTQLKELDFGNCKKLTYLDLQKSHLKKLNVKGCTALETIDVTYNDLTGIDLSSANNLTTFFADKNQLQTLDLSNNKLLENLSVGSNQLEILDVSMLNKLVYLYCNDNKIAELNPASNYLKVIMAQNNQICGIDLSKCSNVTIAAFNNNKLTRADLTNCIMLQSLWLNDNKLSSVIPPKKMPFLNVLNIANNEFESFDFNLASSASEIVANNNKLSGTVDLSKCYVLEKFFGSDNNIEKIEFSGSDLTTLIVNNNKLKVLDPKSSSIYWLEAKNNEITGVNVSYGDNLYLAHLDNNKLNSLNLNENNKIVSLSLRNNLFEDNALERIYEQLPVLDDFTPAPEYSGWMKWLFVEGNPGAKTADATIATDKGWLVDVVTPTGIEKMDTDNSGLLFDKTSGKLLLNGTIVTSGRIVSMDGTSRSFDSNNGDFNINNLPHGVYVIRVVADGKTYTKKILK